MQPACPGCNPPDTILTLHSPPTVTKTGHRHQPVWLALPLLQRCFSTHSLTLFILQVLPETPPPPHPHKATAFCVLRSPLSGRPRTCKSWLFPAVAVAQPHPRAFAHVSSPSICTTRVPTSRSSPTCHLLREVPVLHPSPPLSVALFPFTVYLRTWQR